MGIVAVADTHLYHADFVVPDGDIFIHAGGLCRGSSLGGLEGAARWISGLLHHPAGNHVLSVG